MAAGRPARSGSILLTQSHTPVRWRAFMLPRDIGLFLRSARTDRAIAARQSAEGSRAAFEAAYAGGADPWASANPAYRYQRRKYEVLAGLLPDRPFARALDLGCGHGLFARHLAPRAGHVLGLDLAQAAIDQARKLSAHLPNLAFEQADLTDLPAELDGQFDLVVVADTLYYLSPLPDALLKAMALRVARLLAPGGLCLLANHFFFSADAESRLSQRIHRAFAWSPALSVVSEHRRAFFLASLLQAASE